MFLLLYIFVLSNSFTIDRNQGTDDDSSGAELVSLSSSPASIGANNRRLDSHNHDSGDGAHHHDDDMHDTVYDNNVTAVIAGLVVAVLLICGFGVCFARKKSRARATAKAINNEAYVDHGQATVHGAHVDHGQATVQTGTATSIA